MAFGDRGRAVLEGVGGDILNPREGGDAYDEMLRNLHRVVEAHDPASHRWGDVRTPFEMNDHYRHLWGVIEGATDTSYADLLRLRWSGKDWEIKGREFMRAVIFGSSNLITIDIDYDNAEATISDYENSRRKRVGEWTLLLGSTSNIIPNLERDYTPDESHLTNGYVIVPEVTTVDIFDKSGRLNGDTVRRALDPFAQQIGSVAADLAREADRSEVK